MNREQMIDDIMKTKHVEQFNLTVIKINDFNNF